MTLRFILGRVRRGRDSGGVRRTENVDSGGERRTENVEKYEEGRNVSGEMWEGSGKESSWRGVHGGTTTGPKTDVGRGGGKDMALGGGGWPAGARCRMRGAGRGWGWAHTLASEGGIVCGGRQWGAAVRGRQWGAQILQESGWPFVQLVSVGHVTMGGRSFCAGGWLGGGGVSYGHGGARARESCCEKRGKGGMVTRRGKKGDF